MRRVGDDARRRQRGVRHLVELVGVGWWHGTDTSLARTGLSDMSDPNVASRHINLVLRITGTGARADGSAPSDSDLKAGGRVSARRLAASSPRTPSRSRRRRPNRPRAGLSAARQTSPALQRDACVRHDRRQFAGLEHLTDDVASADELALDVKLGNRRPIGVFLDALANVRRPRARSRRKPARRDNPGSGPPGRKTRIAEIRAFPS